ncbi:hypothetical protein NDU88_007385 [Pleurodeles waltl]|uniref:Uncharacterized protein n=1 Tax=Pleurodeles waltl TaxID=8319 RepID=A0AAV7U0I7_PLEWA|nr:hypothetical protein NDU88_007385 [Pleurodeles waltl]
MARSSLRESFSRCSCVRGPIHWGPGPGAQCRCLRRQSLHSGRPPGEQAPHWSAAASHSRPHLDSRASFSPDGGDPLASQDVSHISRTPAQMHSGVRVARSLRQSSSPQSRFASHRPTRGPGLEAQGRLLQRLPPSGRISRRAPHLGFGRAPQSRPPSWIYRTGRGRCFYGSNMPKVVSGGISGVQEPMGISRAAPVMWIVAAS